MSSDFLRMPRQTIKFLAAACLLLPAFSAHAADAARGKIIAQVRCMPCHHLDRTTRSIGPGLKGVYGRVPTITGVPFTHWNAEALDAWLSDPRAIKPNTEMVKLPISARDRADVIAYFKQDAAAAKAARARLQAKR